MQAGRRLPGAKTHAGHPFALLAGGVQRQAAAVAGDYVAALHQALHLDLQSLHRGIDVARGAARAALFAQHVPGLGGLAHFNIDAGMMRVAENRIAKLEVRREPFGFELIAGAVQIAQHVAKILRRQNAAA